METKRLYRSNTDKVWAGICGGIGEFFNTDPVLIRVIWLVLSIMTGIFPGLLAYIITIFIIPKKPLV